ncbi:helix-turn-helix domain-containing protein [Pseudomonas fluorescens]|uniref:helix-turn-helix domain-containing protein n=1 Tax=Pseudomonas fluorescens TaxID=294 RepID=UPI001BE82F00|nr:helix-turn-helix domain-containing protein [Pseudomonas fluorescens]MBT2373157.1 helix-turn-helix domain-containing protein [Pseudomonas fluorescens]
MSLSKNKTIYVAEALPGSGKSTKFIEKLPLLLHTSRIVYAMPTNALIQELALTIKVRAGLSPLVVTSDTVDHVIAHLEKVLAASTQPLVMITHEALRRVDPRLLEGWELVVDEIPSVSDCKGYQFDSISYLGSLGNYLDVSPEKKATLKTENTALVENMIRSKDSSALSDSALDVLKAMLTPKCSVEVEAQSTKGKRLVRIVRYRDFLPAFSNANSVHILANNVKDTLLGVHATYQGWQFEPSIFTPDFDGYGKRVELHPFLTTKYSKTQSMMQRNGKPADAWDEGVQLADWLRCITAMVGDEKGLAFAHQWMQYNFSDSITKLPIDSRGINGYQDRHIAICLQHGNVSCDDALSFHTLCEMLGVPVSEVRKAIEFERFYESTLQAVARTSLRDRNSTEPVTLFVQSMDMAEYLKGKLGRLASINTELVMSPWEKQESEKKKAKAQQQAEVISLLIEAGKSRQHIAKELGIPYPTVKRWTKGLEQAA